MSFVLLMLSASACSEARSVQDAGFTLDMGSSTLDSGSTGSDLGARDAGRDSSTAGGDMGAVADLGMGVDAGTALDAGAPPSVEGLVINEVRAQGDDWIELYNASSGAISLAGLQITDSSAPGSPALDHTTTFPAGLTIESGAYFVVVADLGTETRDGLQVDCLSGALPTCVEASYGISKTEGDELFVLGPDNAVLVSATYPPNAVIDGQSWARLPDGTGDFAAGNPTPGAANAAP
ncbi:MAG: lamin tail domain-containing protein [Sandaracinaceae bacterium]|nr:lamin tail domain-containing protein [Sandaracinaceae bacterium]